MPDQFEQATATLRMCDALNDQRWDGIEPVGALALVAILLIGFWLGRFTA